MLKALTFDTETNGLELKEITNIWCLVGIDMESMAISEFGPDQIGKALDYLSSAQHLIGHNIICYDLPVLKHLYGWIPSIDTRITDTLVLSRLSNPDRVKPFACGPKVGPHSVEAWGYRLGRKKVEHEDWTQFSPEMLHRCREDCQIQVQIYNELFKELSK